MKKFTKRDFLIFGGCIVLAVAAMIYQQNFQKENAIYFPRPLSDDDIQKYGNNDPKAVIIYPTLTYNAYKDGGFYDYYKGICKTCNTIPLDTKVNATYTTGLSGFQYLTQLHYNYITDLDVDKNPSILEKYDKIILLHNEYMTQHEFTAITSHKNVIYLYPNSVYVQVSVDYNKLTESLVKGHGYDGTMNPPYPVKTGIASGNGFGYVTNSNHEYDLNCKNYKWELMPNGMQITCWSEFLIKADRSVLQTIKDYPQITPPLLTLVNTVNVTSLPHCDQYGNCEHP